MGEGVENEKKGKPKGKFLHKHKKKREMATKLVLSRSKAKKTLRKTCKRSSWRYCGAYKEKQEEGVCGGLVEKRDSSSARAQAGGCGAEAAFSLIPSFIHFVILSFLVLHY